MVWNHRVTLECVLQGAAPLVKDYSDSMNQLVLFVDVVVVVIVHHNNRFPNHTNATESPATMVHVP